MSKANEPFGRHRQLFLDLLDRPISFGTYTPISLQLIPRVSELTNGIAVDQDTPIDGEVDL
jgi:hypothetical protein